MTDNHPMHWWQTAPWRMVQTNFREIDMEDIDADTYVKELQAFHATLALINTGGILASYDTQVEDHPRCEYLHGDSLKKIMDACHAAGIRVAARMDFSKMRFSVYQRHPDWAYRTRDGQIVNYNGDVHTCLCGGFQQQKAFEILEEVIRTLPIDAVFINMGGFKATDYSYRYYGPCHCAACQKAFRDMFGLEIPDREDSDDPACRKYALFKDRVTSEYQKKLAAFIKGLNPEIAIDKVDFRRVESKTEYKRLLPYVPFGTSSIIRGIRGTGNGLPCTSPSVDFIGFFIRHVAVSPAMQALRCWENIANLGLLDYYVMGRLDNHEDKSGYAEVRRVFAYHKAHEAFYRGMRPRADVLLIRQGAYDPSPDGLGWMRALSEGHFLFDEAEPNLLNDQAELSRYRAVIVSALRKLSRHQAALLDTYVRQGGTLIVDGPTAQYDETGEEYAVCPIESLGIESIRARREDMVSAMLKIGEKDKPLFRSFPDSSLLYIGDDWVDAAYAPDVQGYLRLIPPHMYGPPERCYYTEITEAPGVTCHPCGQGRAVHIPWRPGLLYRRDGYANTFCFMKDVIQLLAGVTPISDATPMLEITLDETEDQSRALLQLVNATGHFSTSYFQPVPLHDQMITVPLASKPARVVSLVTEREPEWHYKNGLLTVRAECKGYFNCYHIQCEGDGNAKHS